MFYVGNVMIDSLINHLSAADGSDIVSRLGLKCGQYALVRLHRPSNVDDLKNSSILVETLIELSRKITIVFLVHPRTLKNSRNFGLLQGFQNNKNIILTDSLNYLDF
jgi:UDP-N-acetylglucosamine 2-epimerase (non-hydrolysing)